MPNFISLDSACQILNGVDRIMVIGCSGGGKSTLAQRIGEQLNLNYISIDKDVRWLPGWKVRNLEDRKAIVDRLVLESRWIMDGTYPTSFDVRLPRTDLVLWVRVPRRVALASVYKRSIKYYGTTRPDMADGCVEQLPDKEFVSYIWNFERKVSPVVLRNLDLHGPDVPVLVLKSRREMNLLVSRRD